jgi:hypothetical protein
LISTLLILGAAAGDGADDAEEGVDGGTDDAASGALGGGFGDAVDPEVDDLPFMRPESTGTLPNDLTPSDLIGGTEAGEEEIGAEASFIEPKVTEGPCFTDPIFRVGTLTPSFTCTP